MHKSNSTMDTADRKTGSEWTDKASSLRSPGYRPSREIEAAISWSRRQFLRGVSGGAAAAALSGFSPLRASGVANAQKVVVVTFGGGTRDEETFQPDGLENIPCLLKEFIPQGTIFTQVVNRGILGHYVATASLVTGVYETFNNFAAVKPDNPTVFEYFRKQRRRPASDTWVVAPSNGFGLIGESNHSSHGAGSGAGVILPKKLLAAAIPSDSGSDYDHLLLDNYESPVYAPTLAVNDEQLHQMAQMLKLSVADFTAHARSLRSPDELSVYIAKRLMQQLAPSLLWVTLHDIDVAHAGTYSLYLDGIQRSDRLCSELWQEIEKLPEYAGKTTMFILPDFGRDADESAGGNGFQHHRTGDAYSRTTWMIARGPSVREGLIVDRSVESTDLVPTLGAFLGFTADLSRGKALKELL
jgi:hypothetical protein